MLAFAGAVMPRDGINNPPNFVELFRINEPRLTITIVLADGCLLATRDVRRNRFAGNVQVQFVLQI